MRIDSTTPASGEYPTSPTGTPVFPQWVVKLALFLVAMAGSVVALGLIPSYTIAFKVCVFISTVIAPILGISSQGIRRSAP